MTNPLSPPRPCVPAPLAVPAVALGAAGGLAPAPLMYGWLWRVPMAMLLRNEVSLTPQPGSRGTNLLCEAPGKLPSTLGGTGRAAWGPGVAVPGVRWVLGAAREVLSFLRVTAGIWCLGSGSCPDAPNWGCSAGAGLMDGDGGPSAGLGTSPVAPMAQQHPPWAPIYFHHGLSAAPKTSSVSDLEWGWE